MTERPKSVEDMYCTCVIQTPTEDFGDGLVQCLLCGKQKS